MSGSVGLAGWPMRDVADLAVWGGLMGLSAGIALHFLARGARRATWVQWCLLMGVTALVLFGVVTMIGGNPRLMRKVWALALVGYPAFVAGGVAMTMGRMKSGTKHQAIWAFVLAAALGATIWASSIPVTGKSEPWDADWPYHPIALAAMGAVSGAIIPKHLPAHYLGALAGQGAYEIAFLKMGPLFLLGLAFLAGYTLIFLAAAAIVAAFRKRGSNVATAGKP